MLDRVLDRATDEALFTSSRVSAENWTRGRKRARDGGLTGSTRDENDLSHF